MAEGRSRKPRKRATGGTGDSSGGSGGNGSDHHEPFRGERELVVVAKPAAGLRVRAGEVRAAANIDASPLADILEATGATMLPLFGETEEGVRHAVEKTQAETEIDVPDLSVYYHVEAADDQLDDLAATLLTLDVVEAAYVKPAAEPSVYIDTIAEMSAPSQMAAAEAVPAAATPDFTARQGYLNPAPGGIDARYAWGVAGGRGAGVRIIDVEGAWRFSHEDLRVNQGGVVGGTPTGDLGWENHGTAVIGEFGGDRNGIGITGICPDANVRAVSIFGIGTAAAIRRGADLLRRGDILLIELHRPGPRFNFQGRADQRGYIAIEFWPDDWDAICYAAARGVLVVEAAGNGAENFDDPLYDNRPAGFPATWSNPFRRGARDSGAILAGAGAPPPGTHGRNHGPDRSRLAFSNYGQAVDVQGWGREVTTTGYGGLWRDPGDVNNRDRWYTDTFSGTSSASPIIVGALGCVQGVLRRRGRPPMSPPRARSLLRASGSAQQDAPGRPRTQRIGNRPNLRQLISRALQTRTWVGVQFRGEVPPNATRRWFTFNWPAQWHVLWSVIPTTPHRGAPQIDFDVHVERASHERITYWIVVRNLTNETVQIEGRYAVMGET